MGESTVNNDNINLEDVVHMKVRPLCKPDVHLKKSRHRILNENSIDLIQSFGYQCICGGNLCVLKENVIILVAGNYLNLLNTDTATGKFMPSINGAGFTCIAAHPSSDLFAAAEKGQRFCINIFSYPVLDHCKSLKEEISIMPTCIMQFHPHGELLIAVSADPENRVCIWHWEFESNIFISDDLSRPLYSMHFSTHDEDTFITSGKGHVTFWNVACTRDDRDNIAELVVTLHEELFVESSKVDAYCTISISDSFISATSEGYFLWWNSKPISVDDVRKIAISEDKPCHDGCIYHIITHQRYIISLGSDGYMKFWDYDEICSILKNSEKVEDSASEESKDKDPTTLDESLWEDEVTDIYVNPVKIYLISDSSELIYGVISQIKYDYTTYMLQDKNGRLFEIVISADFSEINIKNLLCGLGSDIVGVTSCPLYPFVAAASKLGNIAVYDCVNKNVCKYESFLVPITSIMWPSAKLDFCSSSLFVGFLDGTLRWMILSDADKFILKFVIKPHVGAIKLIKMNDTCSILITQGSDDKLFFYSVKEYSLFPLGFYINHHEVVDFAWLKYFTSSEPNKYRETLLIICKYGYLIETEIPDTSTFSHSTEFKETYFIETKAYQVYKINGLRNYHKLGDRIHDSDCEDLPDLNEAEKEVLCSLKYEEKKERREKRHAELGLNGPLLSPEILSCLPSVTPNHIWLSLGREDFGYLFEFEFLGHFDAEPVDLIPVKALEILTVEIIPVVAMKYSPCGKFIFMGLQDGSLNMCYLEHAFMPETGYDFAKYQIHDPDEGSVKHINVSTEGNFIVTAGCDGNILVFNFNMFDYKEIEEYGEKPLLIGVTEVEDIPPEKLNIEDQINYEMDQRYSELKQRRICSLEKLKDEFLVLKDKMLTEYSSLCESSLEKLKDVPEELKVKAEEFSASEIALDMHSKATNNLKNNIDVKYNKEIAKSALLYKKYFEFFKSDIEHEKLFVMLNKNTCLSTFRGCAFPSNILEVQLSTYPSMFKPKDKIPSEERRKSEKVWDERLKLENELTALKKSLIDYPSDTPVSELISKYNKRKEKRIEILKEHIAEYEILEYLVTDEKKYQETVNEIETSQFIFKRSKNLEDSTSECICTFAEKKARTALYYKKIYKFWNYFNSLVCSALEYQKGTDKIYPKKNETAVQEALMKVDKHIYSKKGNISEVHTDSLKIQWMKPSYHYEVTTVKNTERIVLYKVEKEILKQQQNIYNNFIYALLAAKPNIVCEKKFHDIRFILKCFELNSFKADLFEEKKWLKIIKELECLLREENLELSDLEEKMFSLKSKRQAEKNEWMNLYKQFCKTIGLKHKHKGYLKEVFKKKIRPDDEKEPYTRHPSSESSGSEQDIDSMDDSHNVDPKDVDQNLLREVMLLRLKRNEIESKMKKYKRSLTAFTTKELTLKRKIQRVKDALQEAWAELSSIPVKRKLEHENIHWPAVLYPENVHRDFINKPTSSAEGEKIIVHKEMSHIYEKICKELRPINNLIRLAVRKAMGTVINAELMDLIDIACVFFPVVDMVSEEMDKYFRGLKCPDSHEIFKEKTELKEEHVNIIQEILSASTKENLHLSLKKGIDLSSKSEVTTKKDTSLTKTQSTTNSKITVEENERTKRTEIPSINFLDDASEIEKTDLHEIMVGHKNTDFKSWRDVCSDLEILSPEEKDSDIDVKSFISDAAPYLDRSLFCEKKCLPHKDYYMLPLKLDACEKTKKIIQQSSLNFDDLAKMLMELDISEVIEDLLSDVVVKEQSVKDADKFVSESFPTYPGGGLFLTKDVLLKMEEEDPDSYPYSNFYQEILDVEESIEKPELIHIVPLYKEKMFKFDLAPLSFSDFILMNINDILKVLKSLYKIKLTAMECEEQFRYLDYTLSKSRNKRINVEQEFLKVSRERVEEMTNKFNRVVNLDHLQDVIENPHLRIKKYESEVKLESLRNDFKKLKTTEVAALKSLDKFSVEDTVVCHKLLELRNTFKSLNRKYSSKLHSFPTRSIKSEK